MRDLLMIRVEGEQSANVIPLALRLGAHRPCLFQRGKTECEILRGRRNMRIKQKGERDSPIRNAALRIGG
jgi:hypothetical protein